MGTIVRRGGGFFLVRPVASFDRLHGEPRRRRESPRYHASTVSPHTIPTEKRRHRRSTSSIPVMHRTRSGVIRGEHTAVGHAGRPSIHHSSDSGQRFPGPYAHMWATHQNTLTEAASQVQQRSGPRDTALGLNHQHTSTRWHEADGAPRRWQLPPIQSATFFTFGGG